jgi:hypothetical protein
MELLAQLDIPDSIKNVSVSGIFVLFLIKLILEFKASNLFKKEEPKETKDTFYPVHPEIAHSLTQIAKIYESTISSTVKHEAFIVQQTEILKNLNIRMETIERISLTKLEMIKDLQSQLLKR